MLCHGKRGFLVKRGLMQNWNFYKYLIQFLSKFHETSMLYCLLKVQHVPLVFLMCEFFKLTFCHGKRWLLAKFQFLAPLAEGQRAIVMALGPSCVRSSVSACVHKLFLQKTSPQKLLTGFLQNFTGMFLRWSSFKFLQIIVFYEEF